MILKYFLGSKIFWIKNMFLCSIFLLSFVVFGEAVDIGLLAKNNLNKVSIQEKQVVEINKSLKNIIEENQGLVNKNTSLEGKVRKLKGDFVFQKSRYDSLKKDRDGLSVNVKKIRNTNRLYSKKIKQLEKTISQLKTVEEEYIQKQEILKEASQNLNGSDDVFIQRENILLVAALDNAETVKKRETKTMDLLAKIDAFAEEDERLRTDSAKAHYNMGNIYFQKGEYEIAAREYYQAVTLMPNDADVHYNLAFVNSEYLDDHKTALKHYRMYLYLNPQAKDRSFIMQKILHSELFLRGAVDSPLERSN